MWMVVKFYDGDDVASAPTTWIKKENNEITCFWPNKNVEKLRRSTEIPDASEGRFYSCKILMNGSK